MDPVLAFLKANWRQAAIAFVVFLAVGRFFGNDQWGIVPLGAGIAAFFAAEALIK